MKLVTRRTILSLFLLINLALATGPSYVYSMIIPIAINDNGDVLCKSAFSENPMGAHDLMPIRYALCLVKDKKITFLEEFLFNPYDDEKRVAVSPWDHYDSFQKKFDDMQYAPNSFLLEKHYSTLKEHGFQVINPSDYRVAPLFSLNDFDKKYNKKYEDLPQLALYLSSPIASMDTVADKSKDELFKQVKILYKINNQLWLLHDNSIDNEEYSAIDMINFYAHPFYDAQSAQEFDLEYEIQTVNSIIFLDTEDN